MLKLLIEQVFHFSVSFFINLLFCGLQIDQLSKLSQFEQEIRDEQEEKKRVAEERKVRKAAFKATAKFFETQKYT